MNLNMNFRSERFKPGKRDYLPKTYLQMNKSDLYLLRRFAFALEFFYGND